MKNCRRCGL